METDESFLKKVREDVFSRPETTLYLHTGYFMSWFAATELQLTLMLAIALRYKRLDDFDLLVRGMDARTKCERLRNACKKYKPMGPNLSTRLDHFERKICGVRNKVAHRYLALPNNDGPVYLATLAKMPYLAFGEKQIGEKPDEMSLLELFEYGLWLNFFSQDLGPLTAQPDRETFEIDQPRSPAPLAGSQPSSRKARRAKPDKPARK
jgi:hypothetical protein